MVVKKIGDFLKLHEPVPSLDVACGTGQSTLTLKEVAYQVVGTDTSREMLDRALREAGVQYVEASAEDLPLRMGPSAWSRSPWPSTGSSARAALPSPVGCLTWAGG